jgi:Ca2+-binding EF-hand superfamily protein
MSKNTKKVEFNAKRYERNGLTADEVLEIKEAFDLFDSDGSGSISVDELKQALRNLGIDARNQTLSNMMNDLDKNNDQNIDFDEFIDMMTAKMSDTDNREDLLKVYNLFLGEDAGTRNDKIKIQHLRRVAKELNEAMSEDELNEMIARADLDKDGAVSFDEFFAIMTKKI